MFDSLTQLYGPLPSPPIGSFKQISATANHNMCHLECHFIITIFKCIRIHKQSTESLCGSQRRLMKIFGQNTNEL